MDNNNNQTPKETKFRHHKWSVYYLFPIVIGLTTIGILLFLIFGGFSSCSNNNSTSNSTSNSETTLLKEYSFSSPTIDSDIVYHPVSDESLMYLDSNNGQYEWNKLNSVIEIKNISSSTHLLFDINIMQFVKDETSGINNNNLMLKAYDNLNNELCSITNQNPLSLNTHNYLEIDANNVSNIKVTFLNYLSYNNGGSYIYFNKISLYSI